MHKRSVLLDAKRSHAVVIGSGIGGLAGAIRLGARGYRVTLLERLETLGGRARVHHQDGFTFDAGPTIITAPFLLEELWSLCGKTFAEDVTLKLMDPFYRIRFDSGRVFNYGGSRDQIRNEVARFAPADLDGYDRYLRKSEAIFDVGFRQLSDVPFSSIADMLRIVPKMISLKSYRTVFGLVASYVKDPELRIALSFHPLLVGGNPFSVTSIYSLISYLEQEWGVYSAMGGTGTIVDGMARLIAGQGGEIKTGCTVVRINVTNGRASGVTLAGGDTIDADIVVSNADVSWTYRHLVEPRYRRKWSDSKVDRMHYSNGLFVWYFGTRCQYPEVAHHTILLGPRYRALLEDIFGSRRLPDDPSLYLHRPTATDPELAPEGCDAFYVLAPVPHLDGDTDWPADAEGFRQRVEDQLSATVLPGLGDALITSKVTTPLDFQNDLLSYKGAGFSLEPRLSQSAWFRPHNVSEDIANLFFVGAGTHPGAGVPGVLSSARILDKVVRHGQRA